MFRLIRKAFFPSLLFCPLKPRHFRCIPGIFDVKYALYGINVPPDGTQNHTPSGGTSLEEGSARRRELYLATFNAFQ